MLILPSCPFSMFFFFCFLCFFFWFFLLLFVFFFFFSFLSFLYVNKNPPSLLYLLVTIGAACLFLSITEKTKGAVVRVVSIYGRVPMFYYLIHIYVIHLIAVIASAFIPGQDWKLWFLTKPIWFTTDLKGYGFSLPVAYLVWIGIVIA